MTTIVTRAGKGAALTWTEADANFTNLNTYKVEQYAPAVYCKYGYTGVTSPVTWSNTLQPTFGFASGPNAETVMFNNSGSQSVFGHGIYVGSDYNIKYAAASTTPAYISMSGGQMTFYVCSSSGTAGTTATFTAPLKVYGSDQSVRINDEIVGAVNGIEFRNRIINGDMRISQRLVSTATTVDGGYPVDRFVMFKSGTGAFSAQRLTASPPTGHSHYVRYTVTTADTAAAAEYYGIRQNIEGVNIVDLAFGSASAKTVTLSFWVRSSLTGTFSGSLMNSAVNRAYPFTYTISSANTWEQKTVTIAGDTSGTWLTDTGVGLRVSFDMGSGSNYLATAGAWAAGNYSGATGHTAVQATLNATWDLTGVQLEAGPVASPFERRPFATELQLCQRYYQKTFALETAPADNVTTSGALTVGIGNYTSTFGGQWTFPTRMRTSPAPVYYSPQGGTAGYWRNLGNTQSSQPSAAGTGEAGIFVCMNAGSVWTTGFADFMQIHIAVSAEL